MEIKPSVEKVTVEEVRFSKMQWYLHLKRGVKE